jgi:hypothetical protein
VFLQTDRLGQPIFNIIHKSVLTDRPVAYYPKAFLHTFQLWRHVEIDRRRSWTSVSAAAAEKSTTTKLILSLFLPVIIPTAVFCLLIISSYKCDWMLSIFFLLAPRRSAEQRSSEWRPVNWRSGIWSKWTINQCYRSSFSVLTFCWMLWYRVFAVQTVILQSIELYNDIMSFCIMHFWAMTFCTIPFWAVTFCIMPFWVVTFWEVQFWVMLFS